MVVLKRAYAKAVYWRIIASNSASVKFSLPFMVYVIVPWICMECHNFSMVLIHFSRRISRYEKAVEARNFAGIQLIDRNDELCILWEKSNIQEKLLKRGEDAMHSKDEEVRKAANGSRRRILCFMIN